MVRLLGDPTATPTTIVVSVHFFLKFYSLITFTYKNDRVHKVTVNDLIIVPAAYIQGLKKN